MFRLIAADLRRQWLGAAAVALLIVLATALGVVVTLQERALRLGSARAAAAFDVVIGAPGSETQLVLSSVFLQAAPLPLLPGRVLAALLDDPKVAWAAPVGFGDFAGPYPIVGTTQSLVDGIGGLGAGSAFAKLGEAVVGAHVDRAIGETIQPMHGESHWPASLHHGVTYRVVGRLRPTGTPWDRAVLVPIEAVWRLHAHGANADEHDGRAAPGRAADAAPRPPRFEVPIDPAALTAPGAPGLPAIVVKPRTIADAYKLRRQWRTERSLAVFPGEVLTRLYGTLGDARTVLSLVAWGAQGLVLAAVLLVVVLHVLQRRRQIGALRAFGARREIIVLLVWLEAFAILAAGVVAGFAVGYGAARLLSAGLTATSGVALPVAFAGEDAASLAVLLAVGAVAAALPALLAYRQSPAAALRS
ncbi:FtsX-like permease family protein [Chelatococcus reniformis]|uniref:Membrane protein n=1 Tax=Chelatococcus reniformis TaxID=1494448 RepID=A0A916U8L5_9HYPH|nr:ABC transporter permease [Chelatococcus reniformis]GGC63792.1 membrane protein [Chelatococcus reniformis]